MAPARRNGGPADASFDAPSKRQRQELDRQQSAPYRAAYDQGRSAGRAEARSSTTRRSSSGRRPSRSRAPARVLRSLEAPVRAQVGSGLRLLSMTLLVVALYAVLSSASVFAGALGSLGRGLEWLRAPDRGIPARLA